MHRQHPDDSVFIQAWILLRHGNIERPPSSADAQPRHDVPVRSVVLRSREQKIRNRIVRAGIAAYRHRKVTVTGQCSSDSGHCRTRRNARRIKPLDGIGYGGLYIHPSALAGYVTERQGPG